MPRLWYLLLLAISAFAQTTAQTNIVATALGVPSSLTDIQMTGTASWHIGADDDSGSVTLKASRDGKSRIDLLLSKGARSEIRVADPLEPKSYVLTNSVWQQSAVHNNWMDANWFFPAFSSAAIPQIGFTSSSTGTNSIRTQFNVAGQKPRMAQLIQILSITDFEIDPVTHLPTQMRWVTHPDEDYGTSIPVEVRYSDYRDVSGIKVPFHVERYVNGTLQLEITVSDVVLNPGLSASDFAPSAN